MAAAQQLFEDAAARVKRMPMPLLENDVGSISRLLEAAQAHLRLSDGDVAGARVSRQEQRDPDGHWIAFGVTDAKLGAESIIRVLREDNVRARFRHHTVSMVLLTCAVIMVALMAMGVMMALLALLWRQADSIAQVFGIMFEIIGGAYLPVNALPGLVRYLAYPLPHTWGYDLIRYYSFGGNWQTLLPVWQEWAIIIAFAIVFTVASHHLLEKAERLAKKSGLHVI